MIASIRPSGPSGAEPFHDVVILQEPFLQLHYRSGTTVYSESLRDGRLTSNGWNAAGFLPMAGAAPWSESDHATAGIESFTLEIDGVLLADNWNLVRSETQLRGSGVEAVVALRHGVRPIDVAVHTALDGTAVLHRWLTITNRGERIAAIARADPWSGVLWQRTEPEKTGHALAPVSFRLGYFADDHWGHEGRFVITTLTEAGARINGQYQAGPYRHPMFTLQADPTGETFIGQLAWSGGWHVDVEVTGPAVESDRLGSERRQVLFRTGPDAPAPQRVLLPGESVSTPALHLGLVIGDLDAAVNQMHTHVRLSLGHRDTARIGLVESGIGPEQEMTNAAVLHEIEAAAALGAEVFFLDASWYTNTSSDWFTKVGDWAVAARYPDGLAPFRVRCRELGLRFGLWMEPERVGAASLAVQEHPERLALQSNSRPLRGQLDLADASVCATVEADIAVLIAEHDLDFFRLDYNVGAVGRGFVRNVGGLPENHYWRYYQNLYAMITRLRTRFPDVIFENCASGGARTDLGLVPLFDHTWVTDWQLAPRSFWITNGMTMALPPELIDRHVGAGMNDHLRGDLDFQCRLALFGRPTVGWLHPVGVRPNEHQLARVRRMIDIYKEFVRPWQSGCAIFHHSPGTDGRTTEWGVLEQSSADRRRAVIGLFRLGTARSAEYTVRPRGLDVGENYTVTLDNTGERFEESGRALVDQGIRVRREAPLTSELILIDRTAG